MATTKKIEIPDIKLRQCKPELVRKALTDLKLPTDGTTKAIVTRLAEYYSINQQRIDIADCTECGADSDCDLSACPFCGDAAFEGDPPKGETPADLPADAPATTPKAGPSKKKGGSKKKTSVKKTSVNKKAPEKKTPARKSKITKVAAPNPSTALATTGPDAFVIAERLGVQERICQESMAKGAIAMHEMGVALKIINDEQLWKSITTKDGIPVHRGFKQYIHEALGIKPTSAYNAMNIAEEFVVSDIKGLSGRKAHQLMMLKKDKPTPASNGKGTTQRSDAANALTGKGNTTKPPPPKGAITISTAPGIFNEPMYKRPTVADAKVGDTVDASPTSSITEKPWFALQLENEVRLIVRITTNKKGEWIASGQFRKGEKIQ